MTFRRILSSLARALGVSCDTRAAYAAPVAMQRSIVRKVYASQIGGAWNDSTVWHVASAPNGERITAASREAMDSLLAAFGCVAA